MIIAALSQCVTGQKNTVPAMMGSMDEDRMGEDERALFLRFK